MKRILAIVLAAMLLLTFLAACKTDDPGSSTPTPAPATSGEDPAPPDDNTDTGDSTDGGYYPGEISVSMIESWYAAVSYGNGDMPVQQAIEEATNLTITWNVMPGAEYVEAMQVRMGAGVDLDDIIMTMQPLGSYLERGLMVNLDPYITPEAAPYLTQMIIDYPNLRNAMFFEDGLYNLPVFMDNFPALESVWIRNDWLQAVGLPIPKTVDEYVDALVAFQENDVNGSGVKDEMVVAFGFDTGTYQTYFGNVFHMNFGQMYWSINAAGKAEHDYMTDRGLEYLTVMNKMYELGVLDPEYVDMPIDTMIARIANDQASSLVWYPWSKSWLESFQPDADYTIAVLEGPYGRQQYYKQQEFQGYGFVTSFCEDPSLAVRIFEFYLASPEGQILSNWGVEGITWEWDGNERRFTDFVTANPEGLANSDAQRSIGMGLNLPNRFDLDAYFAAYDESDLAEQAKVVPFLQGFDGFMYILPNGEEADLMATVGKDIDTYILEMTAKFIAGIEPLSKYSEFQDNLIALGIEQIGATYDARQSRS